jgi:hypothetical protein
VDLARVFGVTTDYLLKEEHESLDGRHADNHELDHDPSEMPEAEQSRNKSTGGDRKIKQRLAMVYWPLIRNVNMIY